jgi:hypothetical protein
MPQARLGARGGGMVAVLCALACVLVAPATAAQAITQTFNYTGAEQTFTVPAGVTSVEVLAVGGHGGSAARSAGVGAQVTGTLSVTPGETLYVEVGGNGEDGSPNGGGFANGGFNGGEGGGAGGGGASDVRTSPRSDGLFPDDRLLVAGGGGGSGQSGSCTGGAGGAAEQAGEAGSCGNGPGGGGTQSSGGEGGTGGCGHGEAGQLGVGGVGGGNGFNDEICDLDTGGGGGGGYYGGGGGCGASADASGGGGGGSSLVPEGGTVELASPDVEPQIQVTYAPPPVNPPTVATDPATSVKQTSAKLNATVNPEGSEVTACFFEYGTSPAYGSTAPCSSLPGSGRSAVPVSASLAGLSPRTTYDFRIVATNAHGTSYGGEQSFTTLPSPPAVRTGAASEVEPSTATLNATVNPEGSTVTVCFFEYGTSVAYGSSVPCSSLPGSGTSPVAVAGAIAALTANTTYHYRIVAGNGGGVSVGADASFKTAPPQEELPEIGRCSKLKKATGKYLTAGCTTKSEGEDTGSYEWSFEPGAARSFTFKNGSATLETVAKVQIKCAENTYSGEYTGSKTATVDLKLTGCEPMNRLGIKCESQGAASGEVVLDTLEGRLGFIQAGSEPTVGLALRPTSASAPYVAQFHCGEVPVALTGAVIAGYTAVNKMVASFTVSFKATAGKQTPEALEGGTPEVLSMAIGEAAAEQTGLKAADKASNQESLEIKASS